MQADKSVMRLTKEFFSEIKSQTYFITEIAELPVIFGENRSYAYYVRRKNNKFGEQEFVNINYINEFFHFLFL